MGYFPAFTIGLFYVGVFYKLFNLFIYRIVFIKGINKWNHGLVSPRFWEHQFPT